ncbi:MAG: tetratricopeptide repeat protein [Xanthobacteraceae bacterium]|nr:tetratricopeptide repeat protein [Xanthobacteraceae bacterium]
MKSRFRVAAVAYAAIGLGMTTPGVTAEALTQQDIDRCVNKGWAFSPDQAASGCTVAIKSGKWSGQDLAWAYRDRGLAYSHAHDFDRAIADLEQSIKLDPKPAIAHLSLGNAYAAKRDFARAIASLDRAIEIDPKYATAYNDRGIIYDHKGDYDHAIADLVKATELNPLEPRFFNSLCWARGAAGRDLPQALQDCNRAVALAPADQNGYAMNSRGLIQFRLGAYDKAIEDFSAAIAQDPKDADSLYARGISRLRAGDRSGGAADVAAAKVVNPDVADPWTAVGVK